MKTMTILRRNFWARKAGNETDRARLNEDALTSEYYPSHRYLVRWPINTPQRHVNMTFRTRGEATQFIAQHDEPQTGLPATGESPRPKLCNAAD